MKNIVVGSANSKPGELIKGILRVFNSELELDVWICQGEKTGPTCFISGGVHGNEINGPAFVDKIMNDITPKELSGTVIYLPVSNPTGFAALSRRVPEDNGDLNRSYLQTEPNSLSKQIAKTINDSIISICDFGIDCHDAGSTTALIPQPRVHVNETGICNDGCTLDLGKLFGSQIVLQREGKKGMMAIETFKRYKKPILTVEIGGGLKVWHEQINKGLTGIRNILIHYEMLEGAIDLPEKQFVITDDKRQTQRASIAGLLEMKVSLGDIVHSGQELGVITDPATQKSEVYKSDHCGLVFSVSTIDKLNADDRIASILQTASCSIHHTEVTAKAI